MTEIMKQKPQGNFIYLLVGLLMLLLLAPATADYFPDNSGLRIQLAFALIMIIGVWSFLSNRLWFYAGVALAILSISFSTMNYMEPSKTLEILSLCVALLFCILSVIIVVRQIMFSGHISANELIGSVCIYLLLGVIWALFYLFIDLLSHNAFQGTLLHTRELEIWDYIYFSFVTLTTLGFGDISPVNEMARSLVYFEAICGQFYIAVLVASLVGGFMAEKVGQQHRK